LSLENLMTYPWIASRVAAGSLHLHGWYFDITAGAMLHYQPDSQGFQPIDLDGDE
jgi:carbonic anhydrase